MFITFEGIDGCGKTTQIRLLGEVYYQRKISFVTTREPGGTAIGQHIRNMLLDVDNVSLAPVSELLLFAADRAQHVIEFIVPALQRNEVVLCDRFIDSTYAYQVGGRGLAEPIIDSAINIATGGLRPDKTFLFDISPQVGLQRAARVQSADRFEVLDLSFYDRIRATYLERAAKDPSRFVVLDSERNSIEALHQEILSHI